MFRSADRQTTFFDTAFWVGAVVPADSMYGRLNRHGDEWFRDADYAFLYKDTGLGRPCIPPSLIVKSLLLQNYANLSDRDLVDAIRYDIRYKYGLNLPLNHEGFDPSLLSVFRARLLVNDKERAVFERSVEKAIESGILTAKEGQAIDSSPIIGSAALQDTFTLLRTGIIKVLRAIDWQRKKWEGSRGFQYPYKKERYLANPGKPDIEWEEGPEVPDATFVLGQPIYVLFQIKGFSTDTSGMLKVQEDLLVTGPDGSKVLDKKNVLDLNLDAAGGDSLTANNEITLHDDAEAGDYRVTLLVHDRISGSDLEQEVKFSVQGASGDSEVRD